jgi:peroxiredoxin
MAAMDEKLATSDMPEEAATMSDDVMVVAQPRSNRFGLILLLIGALIFGTGAALLVLQPGQRAGQSGISSVPIGAGAGVREGRPAPAFELESLDGSRTIALADLKGKRVLVNFWASWCPPCIKETPDLVEAYTALNDPNIAFVGIGLTDERAKLKTFAEQYKIPYLLVDDPEGRAGDAYGVRGMPTTLLIDEAGVVQKIWVGPVDKAQVLQALGR